MLRGDTTVRTGLGLSTVWTLVAPATVFNFGFADRWEAEFEGQGQLPISLSDQSAALTDAGVFLKHVLRSGSFQNMSGPSIATEFGTLLPGINADKGFGASVAGMTAPRVGHHPLQR